MYIRLKYSKKAKYPTMQIVEGVREGTKVRQRTVAHLGVVKGKKDLETDIEQILLITNLQQCGADN